MGGSDQVDVASVPPEGTASVTEAAAPAECPERSQSAPFRDDGSSRLELIGEANGLEIYGAEYPLPGPTEGLWSSWGQGIVSSVNGRYYSAVGDHLGPDGNSYIFEYDPSERSITRVMDVISLTDHQPGAWGYGKMHSQMVEGTCGSIFAFTYWGTRRELEYGDGYEGDLLLEIDPHTRSIANHGPLVGRRGVPSLAATADGRYLVAEAVEAETDDGDLAVIDTETVEVIHHIDDPDHVGFRSLAVGTGRVWYSVVDHQLRSLDPESGQTGAASIPLPGDSPSDDADFLRAVTPERPDGGFVGVTNDDGRLFVVDEALEVDVLPSAISYTTSLAVAGDRVLWLPGAHGSAHEIGAEVMSLDLASGEVSPVVSLLEPVTEELGVLPGGTYSIAYAEGRLFLVLNASPPGDDSGFGTVALIVIEGL